MPLKRPYYALHQIDTGKYTVGAEYYRQDGKIYVGPYHVLPNEQVFTGFVPRSDSKEIFILNGQFEEASVYRGLTSIKVGKYTSPVYHLPIPTDEDKNNGYITRYFVQQRNNPRSTITEIDVEQYNAVNKLNAPGINGGIWRKVKFDWRISGDIDYIIEINKRTVGSLSNTFKGLNKYLSNYIELIS